MGKEDAASFSIWGMKQRVSVDRCCRLYSGDEFDNHKDGLTAARGGHRGDEKVSGI